MTVFHYVVLAAFVLFAVADTVGRRTAFPNVPFWRVMGAISFVLYFTIATYAPFLWDAWFGAHQLIDGSALPFWAQIVTGFLILEFGIYFWHRTCMHGTRCGVSPIRCTTPPSGSTSGVRTTSIRSIRSAGRSWVQPVWSGFSG